MLLKRLRHLTDSFMGAALGAALYGSWAIYANWDAGLGSAIKTACTQCVVSVVVTYFEFMLMHSCYHHLRLPPSLSAVLALACGLSATYLFSIALHIAMSTPYIGLTLLAGVLPNLIISASYALLLLRTQPVETT